MMNLKANVDYIKKELNGLSITEYKLAKQERDSLQHSSQADNGENSSNMEQENDTTAQQEVGTVVDV